MHRKRLKAFFAVTWSYCTTDLHLISPSSANFYNEDLVIRSFYGQPSSFADSRSTGNRPLGDLSRNNVVNL